MHDDAGKYSPRAQKTAHVQTIHLSVYVFPIPSTSFPPKKQTSPILNSGMRQQETTMECNPARTIDVSH